MRPLCPSLLLPCCKRGGRLCPAPPNLPPPFFCLQELASTAPGFVNASVEFDVASLRPTYRLLWGTAGESNALAVAEGLGFSPTLVAAAREVRQLAA